MGQSQHQVPTSYAFRKLLTMVISTLNDLLTWFNILLLASKFLPSVLHLTLTEELFCYKQWGRGGLARA
jgi:hypothetical protein